MSYQLCSVKKKYDNRGRLQLEDKDEVKKRIGCSPDLADALALTFAEPVFDIGEEHYYGLKHNSIEKLFSEQNHIDNKW